MFLLSRSPQIVTKEARAGRKPKDGFEYAREWLPGRENTPAFAPLFQLPPRYTQRSLYSRRIPHGRVYSFDFFQPPSIRPISFSSLLQIS